MLDNIKMLLGIKQGDTSKDAIINYWIDYYTKMILKYTHQDYLNTDLESILELIVIERLGGIGSQAITSSEQKDISNGIKSITRGDYSVTYKDSIVDKQTSVQLDKHALSYQGQLNLYRRFDC